MRERERERGGGGRGDSDFCEGPYIIHAALTAIASITIAIGYVVYYDLTDLQFLVCRVVLALFARACPSRVP